MGGGGGVRCQTFSFFFFFPDQQTTTSSTGHRVKYGLATNTLNVSNNNVLIFFPLHIGIQRKHFPCSAGDRS